MKHAQDTWTKYKLDVGIFTMEGFERRNTESKQVVRNHTKKKKILLCSHEINYMKSIMISYYNIYIKYTLTT